MAQTTPLCAHNENTGQSELYSKHPPFSLPLLLETEEQFILIWGQMAFLEAQDDINASNAFLKRYSGDAMSSWLVNAFANKTLLFTAAVKSFLLGGRMTGSWWRGKQHVFICEHSSKLLS